MMATSPTPRGVLLKHPLGWVATGFGSGLSPWAPGTVGSLAALLPWFFFLRHLPLPAYLAMLAATFALGCWAAHWVIRETKIEDPGLVVWDEFVGMWIALLLAPPGWPWIVAGFALFRLFDIWKPWPVSWADDRLHGGFGAMLDDAIAGVYALGTLQLLAFLWEGLQAR